MSCAQSSPEFRCPGEKYSISAAVHRGRLARFYPACRHCPHALTAVDFSTRQRRRWAEVHARHDAGPRLIAEGVAGTWHNELSPGRIEQLARAFACQLRRARRDEHPPFAVIVAGDGRLLTAQAVAAAVNGVRWAGANVIHIGPASAPCAALAADHWQAAGALLVGNPHGRNNTVGLKFWAASRPLSAGQGLEWLEPALRAVADRPTRCYGALRQVAAEEPYLAALGEYYHALRPLRVVVHSTCAPAGKYFAQLAARVACQVIPLDDGRRLSDAVTEHAAHFGVLIDDDGERSELVDEQGRAIPAERLLLLIARHLLAAEPGGTIALEPEVSRSVAERIAAMGGQTVSAGSTRAAMEATLRQHGAVLGGGPRGRFWYACGPAVADALRTLTYLLVLSSRSDRRLSEVLDAEARLD
jgi:phosphomannomutase/phosphoglucomutase